MTDSDNTDPLPPAVLALMERQQTLAQELSQSTSALQQALLEHGVPERAAATNEPAEHNSWLPAMLATLQHGTTETDAVEALMDAVQVLLPASAGAVSLIRDTDASAIAAAWHSGQRWTQTRSMSGTNADDEGLLESLSRYPTERSVRIIISGLGLTVGEMRLWPGDSGTLDERRATQIKAIVGVAGLALAGITVKHRLRHRSAQDALTGLFNRRYMEDTLARELHRARRNGTTLGLIIFELDHIADVADRYGNETVDRYLEATGGILQGSFRGSDVCCRLADYRFCVIMPDADVNNTASRAEGLRTPIREIQIRRQGQNVAGMTASVGVAAYPVHADNGDELMAAAESALYRAQEAGGDTLCIAQREG